MKKLLTVFALTLLTASSAQAEDILTILERHQAVTRPAPPKIVPYNYFWCEGSDDGVLGDEDVALENLTVVSENESEAIIKVDMKTMAKIMMDTDDDEEISKSERKMMKKMMERLDGEFVLSKPDARLKQFKIWLTRPMSMALIAKLKEMEVTQSCAIAPNGFIYTDSMTMRVKAKALGQTMRQNMDIRISDLTLR